MRTSILTALALVLALTSNPVDGRHLRRVESMPSDINLTIKLPGGRWEPIKTEGSPPTIDTTSEPMLLGAESSKSAPRSSSPPNKSSKRSGSTCIGPFCGLSLFFALVGLTFAICAIVVYVVDRRFNPWTEAAADQEVKQTNKRRRSSGVDIVRQATAYYQNVAVSVNATLLRRRPLS